MEAAGEAQEGLDGQDAQLLAELAVAQGSGDVAQRRQVWWAGSCCAVSLQPPEHAAGGVLPPAWYATGSSTPPAPACFAMFAVVQAGAHLPEHATLQGAALVVRPQRRCVSGGAEGRGGGLVHRPLVRLGG